MSTRISIRLMAPDQKTLERAARRLEQQTGITFPGLPSHPGRKGDWLAYGWLDVEVPPEEPTRRRPAGAA